MSVTDTTSAPPATTGRGTVVPLHAPEPPPLEVDGPPEDYQPAPPRNGRKKPATPALHERAHNEDAEQQVLGAAMLDTRAATELQAALTAKDFWQPAHETIWDAITALQADGKPCDAVTVADHLGAKTLRTIGGNAYLHTLIASVTTPANALYYADILKQHTLRRAVQEAHTRLLQALEAPDFNPITEITRLTLESSQLRQRANAADYDDLIEVAPDIDTFLAGATDENDTPDWVIPDLLERQDRLIVTAGEGHGKSTLLRQIAVQVASGIHPFTGKTIPPQRVLIIDLENSERQSRRKLRPLRLQGGTHLDPTRLHICCHVQGVNLADHDDRTWLDQIITHTTPDLLITGPIYKMGAGNPNDEKDAKPIAVALDEMRARHDLTIILEAHTAKTPAGVNPKNRPKEPVGWSGWMRWPEFGIHLAEDGKITHWRGMRDERNYPENLARGGQWPFMTDNDRPESTLDQAWPLIKSAVTRAGRRLSQREIADATDISKTTIQRTCTARANELEALYREVEEANQ